MGSLWPHKRSSYPAHAGYPVRHGFSDQSLAAVITGSPAFADDDGVGVTDSIFKQPRGYEPALSRRDAPELCKTIRPGNRGRRECRVPAAPAASRAKLSEAHERSHHRFTGFKPGIPRAMVLTAYTALSPARE